MSTDGAGADVGLLSPMTAGAAAEALTGDTAVVAAMIRTEAALLTTLGQTGIAPEGAGTAAHAVAATKVDAREIALAAPAGGNPVIPLVTRLRESVPTDLREWVHHGATSQDTLDTALMLIASDVGDRLSHDLTALADTLAGLAEESRDVPLVARTLTQQAMPTTLGMRAAGWLAGVHDARRAIAACSPLPASLGGPVGTAAAYGERGPEVLDAFAATLGLRAPVTSWHTRRTPVLELASALAATGAACAKIATDVLAMAQTEVGEVREAPADGAGGSSSMPHKHNPSQSVLVSAAARQIPGLLSTVLSNGAPENERPAGSWHAEWAPLRSLLRLAGAAAERTSTLVPTLVFDHGAMAANLDRLVGSLGKDPAWVEEQISPVGVWIDRVLAEHEQASR
ncbi:MAG: lyase family protein [Nocardioidaceae bacterium]